MEGNQETNARKHRAASGYSDWATCVQFHETNPALIAIESVRRKGSWRNSVHADLLPLLLRGSNQRTQRLH